MQVTKVRNYRAGYQIRYEQLTAEEAGLGGGMELKSAYTPEGHYIGSSRWAHRLTVTRGIKPEIRQDPNNMDANSGRGYPCSIGFCEHEQKWSGWSHRAIYGFGVGDRVKKGDCAYNPANMADFVENAIAFWRSEHHSRIWAEQGVELHGVEGLSICWEHNDTVPNEKMRGQIGSVFMPYPESYGRGEWTAKTLEDCKQMAIDFAEGVS